jgi:hypothetical protein
MLGEAQTPSVPRSEGFLSTLVSRRARRKTLRPGSWAIRSSGRGREGAARGTLARPRPTLRAPATLPPRSASYSERHWACVAASSVCFAVCVPRPSPGSCGGLLARCCDSDGHGPARGVGGVGRESVSAYRRWGGNDRASAGRVSKRCLRYPGPLYGIPGLKPASGLLPLWQRANSQLPWSRLPRAPTVKVR